MPAILSATQLRLPPRLRDISLTLRPGETTGLLGVNGAGKSSVLAALAGVLPLKAGEVQVHGQPLHAQPQLRRHIGWLPQRAPLYDDMSVMENLQFAAQLHKASPKTLGESLEQFELGDLRRRLARKLSGGERMRLGLACCLIHQPDILLLDEPTAGLDPLQAQQLRQLITSLAPQRAVLIASHLLADIETLCQRALMLDRGLIVANEPLILEHTLMLAQFSSPPDDASLLRVAGVERVHSRSGPQLVLQLSADAVAQMPEKLACQGWGLCLWKPLENPLLRHFQALGQARARDGSS